MQSGGHAYAWRLMHGPVTSPDVTPTTETPMSRERQTERVQVPDDVSKDVLRGVKYPAFMIVPAHVKADINARIWQRMENDNA